LPWEKAGYVDAVAAKPVFNRTFATLGKNSTTCNVIPEKTNNLIDDFPRYSSNEETGFKDALQAVDQDDRDYLPSKRLP